MNTDDFFEIQLGLFMTSKEMRNNGFYLSLLILSEYIALDNHF